MIAFSGADEELLLQIPVLVDIHAEATRKRAWPYLDGRVSAASVLIPTSRPLMSILTVARPISTWDDGGMGGRDGQEAIIHRFLTGMLTRFEVCDLRMDAAVEMMKRRAKSLITRLSMKLIRFFSMK